MTNRNSGLSQALLICSISLASPSIIAESTDGIDRLHRGARGGEVQDRVTVRDREWRGIPVNRSDTNSTDSGPRSNTVKAQTPVAAISGAKADRPRNPGVRTRQAASGGDRQVNRSQAWSGRSDRSGWNNEHRRRDEYRSSWRQPYPRRSAGYRHGRDRDNVTVIYYRPPYFTSWGSWYVPLTYAGLRYYYLDGGYYRRSGLGFSLVNGNIGMYLYSLPAGYRTYTIGDVPFYYVNHRYYIRDRIRNAYLQVDDPFDADSGQVSGESDAANRQLYVYANSGQTQEQMDQDKYECHLWAVDQTGIDPSLGETGDYAEYQRARSACLEGRDYTVK